METDFGGKVTRAADDPSRRSQQCRPADGLKRRVLTAGRRFSLALLPQPLGILATRGALWRGGL